MLNYYDKLFINCNFPFVNVTYNMLYNMLYNTVTK